MRHAGNKTLKNLKGLLEKICKQKHIKEKKEGIFYRKSQAFLHFHEDPIGLFADLRMGNKWKRFPVSTKSEQKTFFEYLSMKSNF